MPTTSETATVRKRMHPVPVTSQGVTRPKQLIQVWIRLIISPLKHLTVKLPQKSLAEDLCLVEEDQ